MNNTDMKDSIFKILMNDDNVNNYTKLYIMLYQMDYYKKDYIPNQLIMNKLKINKVNSTRLITEFKKKKIIRVYYKGSKRYFEFIRNKNDDNEKDDFKYIPSDEERKKIKEILNYDWLNDTDNY